MSFSPVVVGFILAAQDEGNVSVSSQQVYPQADAWVAAIHTSAQGGAPVGGGVVIDERRVLTCAHVVMPGGVPLAADAIWVAFPKADPPVAARCRVAAVAAPDGGFDEDRDVAVLELEVPVPDGVTPARLRCPTPKALVGTKWWAFGFPAKQRRGSAADGVIGTALTDGWIRIDAESRYPIEQGFSGGGLWSPDFDAVVGLVGVLDRGQAGQSGQALTIYQAAQLLPGQGLRELAEESRATDSGELALTAWGWTLAADPEGRRHWRPRARGVSIDAERGYRFRGRTAALTMIKAWLDRPAPDRKVLVVTGAPGSGKSAVLGRIVTTADKDAASQLPSADQAVRATEGSAACAVHAKGLTALDIAKQIAKAASAEIPDRIEDFPTALHDALAVRSNQRFNVIIDALDEAATPAEARLTVTKVIRPLAETCADTGAQLVLGSRRRDPDGDLLAAFGGAATLIDLDQQEFFAEEDLAAYAQATLQLSDDERPGNPYESDDVAVPVATRIAHLSDGNFLVAGLTARTHGLYDEAAVDPATLRFSPKVDDAMREYLKRIPDVAGVSAETLLTALAYAESPGLPATLWRIAVRALRFGDVDEAALKMFARSSAASFLVESTGEHGGAEFRLFHQALNDALLHTRANLVDDRDDEQALSRAFIAAGQESGWDDAPGYLLRSLPAHAARAEMMDDLLADESYLLYADLIRVLSEADRAASAGGQRRTRLLRLAPRDVITAEAPARAALFSTTEALENLGSSYTQGNFNAPYRTLWASAPASPAHAALREHSGRVNVVCAFTLNGTTLLASDDAYEPTIRIWDPATGTQQRALTGHTNGVNAICAFTLNGHTHLATASSDQTIRIWDPATEIELRTLTGHTMSVRAVCSFTLDGTTHLATASDDSSVRIWDPATGSLELILTGHDGPVNAVCAFILDGTTHLATASNDSSVRIWDPATGTQQRVLHGHSGWVASLCPVPLEQTTLLASGGHDRTVRVWDPATGACYQTLTRHTGSRNAICSFTHDGRTSLATVSHTSVRIWDPTTGSLELIFTGHDDWVSSICAYTHYGHTRLAIVSNNNVRIWNPTTDFLADPGNWVRSVCGYTLGRGTHLAAASDDRTVRIWNPATGAQERTLTEHDDWVRSICAYTNDRRTRLATASYKAVRIWNPATGRCDRTLNGHEHWVNSVCAFTFNGGTHLATASDDGTVRIWNPATGTQEHALTGHDDWVGSVCAFTPDGATFLASGSHDRTVRIWDPATGAHLRTLTGHKGAVNAICTYTHDGGTLLTTASGDGTVRIWDPMKEDSVLVIPVRDEARAVAYADGLLFIGTATGLLAIRLDLEVLSRLGAAELR
jgi:WD40 repeat protein